ncbi:MAG: PAQR family membrane homeostasis protein TrhA [Desulfopila sp.]
MTIQIKRGENARWQYTLGEEIANSITHGLGILLAIAGLVVLVVDAAGHGDVWRIVATSIFGGSMIVLYTASTLYHSIHGQRIRPFLRMLDHCAIFLLIAGTYTPFTLVSLRGPWGWSLFGAIWGLAVTGIVLELFLARRFRYLVVILYIVMGWVIVVATKPLLDAVAPAGLILLLAGGLCYTIGLPWYITKRIPFGHAVWHLWVLAGTILHFFAILLYVVPILKMP